MGVLGVIKNFYIIILTGNPFIFEIILGTNDLIHQLINNSLKSSDHRYDQMVLCVSL